MLKGLRSSRWSWIGPSRIQRFNLTPSFIRQQSSQAARVDKITSKLPKSLQKYTNGLRNAPVSHIIAFMILHELTAIVPLLALFGIFHYTDYVPISYVTDHFGESVQNGVKRYERYFARKGWFGFEKEDLEKAKGKDEKLSDAEVMDKWNTGEAKYKVVVEVALAYAITKALLPLRIIGSVWATPWFAGWMGKVRKSFTKR